MPSVELRSMENMLTISRRENPARGVNYYFTDVDSDVWTMRNTLALVETQDTYADEMFQLIKLYRNAGTVNTTLATWMTAVSNAVTAKEMVAANEFLNDIGATVEAKIIRFNPFIGTGATPRTTPLIGSSTDTVGASAGWAATTGYTLNGSSQYISTGVAVSGLGSSIGGFGVHYNALTSANQTLIGASDGVNGDFKLTYATSGTATTGTFGGSANSTTDATAIASLVKKYLHLERSSSTNLEYYINGTSTNVQATSTSVTSANDLVQVGCLITDGTRSGYTTGKVSCYCLTNGTMSDANVLTLSNAINAFMGKLGRD